MLGREGMLKRSLKLKDVGKRKDGTCFCKTPASTWFVLTSFSVFKQLLLRFHLFLPSPSDRITSPLVTLWTLSLSHTHTLSMNPSLPLTLSPPCLLEGSFCLTPLIPSFHLLLCILH